MSVTERIIETVELGRNLDLSDDQMDQMLYAIGCTRVMHIADTIIVYYLDQGEEYFIVIAL
jgi:hypothetical protein